MTGSPDAMARCPQETAMPIEQLNNHTHDAGFLHRDWEFSTDRTVDLAIEKFNALAHDGVSAQELMELIASGLDFDQLTDREARQLSASMRQHYDQMSPQAKAIADKFDATLQGRVNDLHDASDDALSGVKHGGWITVHLRSSDPDAAVLEKGELSHFMADLEALARPTMRPVPRDLPFLNEHLPMGFLRG
jgi:hypothetical protein